MAVGGPMYVQVYFSFLDAGKGVFAIDDPAQGVGLYRMDCTRLRTFPVKVHKTWRPRQICFGEDCKLIISGSDHGVVYVFDRRSGEAVDELTEGRNEWVQTVLATSIEGQSSIVAANSKDTEEGTDIVVWRKRLGRRANMESESRRRYLSFFMQLVMIAATVGFIIQNGMVSILLAWVVQRQGA
ncbi:hypothetical protein BT96DRAFT_923807 [Gymnopus androsaceus JB14]|uniref:WD40 repeat-like protein n=1 Tax=Gymnopus androsaceus JB14 TaxID=1447944 RepID=A0A6A4H873_9AGAR|nr:hypothetical protein BT96DRAFT_923807 [Gymnopus androsaceus JB14]